MASPMQSIDPAAIANPPVHVFTDAQFQQLMATLKPGPGFVAKAETAIKTGAEETVANYKALVADLVATQQHVHGAAKQLQLDVKANKWMLIVGLIASAGLLMQVIPLIIHLVK